MIPLLLSAIIFLPLFGGLIVLAFSRYPDRCRWISLGITGADLFLVANLLVQFIQNPGAITVDLLWIETFGIRYALALDGISLLLILLTAFLTLLCVLVSWRSITKRVAAFHFFLLLSQTGVIGLFLATDLFLFYLFWELQVIPLFFLIGIWGHSDRVHAAIKFFIFSITGSLLMLIALIGVVMIHKSQTGEVSFSIYALNTTLLTAKTEGWLYAAFLLAFAIKIPLFPVHTWLPDAHTEAPTAGSVILAGLLLKTGMYGLFRIGFPLFPGAAHNSASVLLILGFIGLFYGAWIALAQQDMKRLVAYSSISHMGLMVIGLALWNRYTLSGSILQMINHGLVTSALFILVGMIDERIGSRQMEKAGGLWRKMPLLSGFFLLFAMASVGLPGLNNFVGEILILAGAFKTRPWVGALGFVGIVFTLVYTLRLIQEVLFGEPKTDDPYPDLSLRETAILGAIAIVVIFIGLHPDPLLNLLEGPVGELLGGTKNLLTLQGY